MSYCKQLGKDKIIFATKEDHAVPSTVNLPDTEPAPGLILPSGEINWNCPCLGGMATGPCGVEFRDAFSCFHYSEKEPKGSECYDTFKVMQECFSRFPTVYNKTGAGDDDEDNSDGLNAILNEETSKTTVTSNTVGNIDSVDQLDENSSLGKSTVDKKTKAVSDT